MHWTAVGVFLVGLGALLGAAPRLVRAPAPELGVSFETLAARADRIRAALETTSVVLLAAGSVVLALVELARWWFELAVVALAVLCVWAIAAHKLRQLWELRENTAQDYAGANPRLASAEEQRTIARNHVRWDLCLRHAFTRTDDWPPAAAAQPCSVARDGPPATPPLVAGSFDSARLVPRHIFALHERDTQLADLAIPSHPCRRAEDPRPRIPCGTRRGRRSRRRSGRPYRSSPTLIAGEQPFRRPARPPALCRGLRGHRRAGAARTEGAAPPGRSHEVRPGRPRPGGRQRGHAMRRGTTVALAALALLAGCSQPQSEPPTVSGMLPHHRPRHRAQRRPAGPTKPSSTPAKTTGCHVRVRAGVPRRRRGTRRRRL